jgi:SAM-dependent methyltransferase
MRDPLDAAPTERFRGRVADYDRWRPGYPAGVLEVIRRETGLRPGRIVADLGSGTGLLAQLFLDNGNVVLGVEPNAAMAEAAVRRFADRAFHDVRGTAEQTGLPEDSVDLVAAGQAFHWFEPAATAAEVRRILKPDGSAAIVWNLRRLSGSPFLAAYEAFLQRWGTDYREVSAQYADPPALRTFFGGDHFARHRFENVQDFDLDGLRGRLLSSSYTPAPGHSDHEAMLAALPALFEAHAEAGRVRFLYDTELYLGPLR